MTPCHILRLTFVLPALVVTISCSGQSAPAPTPAQAAPTPAPSVAPTDTPSPSPTATLLPLAALKSTVQATRAAAPSPTPVEHSVRPTPTPVAAIRSEPTPTVASGSKTADPRLERAVGEISTGVSRARGITFLKPVQAVLVTRPELAGYLVSTIDAGDQKDLADMQELYWELGLLRPSVELYPLYLGLLGEQVRGLFNLETGELLVVAGALPLDGPTKTTLAHELVHALQQQRFDALRLTQEAEGNQDQVLALVALLEGDATLSSAAFAATGLDLAEIVQLLQEAVDAVSPVFENAPEVVQKTLRFPYEDGAKFVSSIQGGPGIWRQVNDAYSRPPASTEQVLHPAKYQANEAPVRVSLPPVLPVLGNGWELLFEDVFGEFLLRTYLNTVLPWPASVRAASGWGGDSFRLLRHGSGQRAFISVIQWDTETDAQEFFDAYQEFTDTAATGAAKVAGTDNARWDSPGRSVHLSLNGDRTLVVIAPGPETIALIVSAISG